MFDVRSTTVQMCQYMYNVSVQVQCVSTSTMCQYMYNVSVQVQCVSTSTMCQYKYSVCNNFLSLTIKKQRKSQAFLSTKVYLCHLVTRVHNNLSINSHELTNLPSYWTT